MGVDEDQQAQDDEDNEEERDQEEPIYNPRHPTQYQPDPTPAQNTEPPLATSTMAPGIFIPPQPSKPYTVRPRVGQPNRSQSFTQLRDGNSYQEVPSVSQGLCSHHSIPATSIQSGARAYFPHTYQQVPDNVQGVEVSDEGGNDEIPAPPPPPLPPYLYHPSPYNHHSYYPPWISPTPFTSMPRPPLHNNYMGYPPFQHPTPGPLPGVQPPSSYPSPYTHPWLPHNIPGVSPMYPYDPLASSGSSMGGYGLHSSHGLFGPSTHPPTQHHRMMGGGYGRGGEGGHGVGGRPYSPSGVSMQVQPPSSPPSAPSLSNLQHTSSLGDNNTGMYIFNPTQNKLSLCG